jgi:hypothetical protein
MTKTSHVILSILSGEVAEVGFNVSHVQKKRTFSRILITTEENVTIDDKKGGDTLQG